jgi:hypothetical protein
MPPNVRAMSRLYCQSLIDDLSVFGAGLCGHNALRGDAAMISTGIVNSPV